MMRRTLATAALALLTLAAGACGGDDDSTGPNGSIAGTYTLRTVNGSPPPITLLEFQDYKVEVTAASVVMNANNTFSATSTFRETDAGEVTTSNSVCTGTYAVSGSTVTFTEPESTNEDCGGSYTGTWSNGNTLTVAFGGGLEAVFRK